MIGPRSNRPLGSARWHRYTCHLPLESAEAVPVVLLHGFTGSACSWNPVVAHLHATGPVMGLNLPGHHPNPEAVPRGFEAVVDHLAGAMRPLGHRPVHLFGYSLGGRVAVGLAARHPHLFARVTLISATAGLQSARERAERREQDAKWINLLRSEGMGAFVAAWERLPILKTASLVAATALDHQRSIRLGHCPQGLADALASLGLGEMPDYWGSLAHWTLPVELVVGARDCKFVRTAHAMAEVLAHAHVTPIPACGHNPLLEAPKAIAALLSAKA